MKREIKFRVWDRALNKMITKENVKGLLDTVNTGDCDTDYTYSRDEWYPAYDILIIFDYFEEIQYRYIEDTSTKRFELMQYTGLKDKNEKEIYEGDIIEWTTLSEKKYRFSVEYSNKYAQYVSVNTKDVSMEYEPLGDYENIKVIGNIYDNPELLGGILSERK